MNKLWLSLGALVVLGAVGFGVLRGIGPAADAGPYDVIATDSETQEPLGAMTAEQVATEFYRVAPEMLTVVYRAFGETDEAAIYDSLAQVSAGDALEALYLERVGAMSGGGLDTSAESDQEIHTMEMLRIDAQRRRDTFRWSARWRVLGTVGHATHLHVRGNIYSAELTVAPVEGAWRITEFELTDVDRTDAGQVVFATP